MRPPSREETYPSACRRTDRHLDTGDAPPPLPSSISCFLLSFLSSPPSHSSFLSSGLLFSLSYFSLSIPPFFFLSSFLLSFLTSCFLSSLPPLDLPSMTQVSSLSCFLFGTCGLALRFPHKLSVLLRGNNKHGGGGGDGLLTGCSRRFVTRAIRQKKVNTNNSDGTAAGRAACSRRERRPINNPSDVRRRQTPQQPHSPAAALHGGLT